MKNLFVLACAIFALSSCADKNKENPVDPQIETPADSLSIPADSTDVASKEEVSEESEEIEVVANKDIKVEYASFGDKIASEKALTKEQMFQKYQTLKKGDTVAVKFKSKINSVCKKKGCWMKMELPNKEESFVRFKDYGFFVPLNADNQEAIVSGKAFINEITVAELQHFASDEGKSQAEIDKITKPKITYAFQADGVLISK